MARGIGSSGCITPILRAKSRTTPTQLSSGPPGLAHDNQRTPNAHISGHLRFKTPPKFHEKTPRETQKRRNSGGKGKPRKSRASKGWGPERVGPRWVGSPNLEKVGPRRVGPHRVGPRRVAAPKGGAPKGWGPERVGPRKGGAPKGWGPPEKVGARRVEPEPRRVGAQNFALFFPFPATKFVLFFPLWGSSRGILVVFEDRGAQMCAFGLSGCRVRAPAAPHGLCPPLGSQLAFLLNIAGRRPAMFSRKAR